MYRSTYIFAYGEVVHCLYFLFNFRLLMHPEPTRALPVRVLVEHYIPFIFKKAALRKGGLVMIIIENRSTSNCFSNLRLVVWSDD